METPEPGPADGEERPVELRPRTRSNPEGAEDRRSSTGSLGGNGISQPAVGSRVEGEGEASTSDSPPTTVTTTVSAAASQAAVPLVAVSSASGSGAEAGTTVQLSAAAAVTLKERPKPPQQQPMLSASVPPPAEYQLRVPRVNCPEKVVGSRHNETMYYYLEIATATYSGRINVITKADPQHFMCLSEIVWSLPVFIYRVPTGS